ncbi:MAG: TGS domain-containing protein, partial [Bacteroidota bacterium]
DSDTYKDIAHKLNETKSARNEYIERFIEPLRKEIDEIGIKYRITGRPKSIYSISNKLKKKRVPFDEIYDLFAVRIIVDVPPRREKPICWWVYSAVTDTYKPIPERLKDWITTPKANGYESLHTTVIGPDGRYVEVQVRSERMDEIAERGFAAHWKYKGISPQPNVYDVWLDNVRETLDTPEGDAVAFLTDFKTTLYAEEVYAYTPKGDMKVLPKGATALDFAFSIHSEVGYHAIAIKVDNQLVPMGYKLKNGDQVHVTTNRSQKPTESWLKMVVTGKARAKIRSAMKEEKRAQGEFGREALRRKFKHLKVADIEESVELLVKHYKYQSHVDLYFDIANEVLTTSDIFKVFRVEMGKLVEISDEKAPTPVPRSEPTRSRVNKIIGKPRLEINGEPADNLHFQFATCCNPVQGDDIFAYLTANAGLKIHRSNCPNAVNLMANYGYRVMKAEWVSTTTTRFVAELLVKGIDDGVGVIQSLTNEISSNLGYNIRSMNISGDEGYYEAKISIIVANTNQLNIVIRKLENLDNVSTVSRVE